MFLEPFLLILLIFPFRRQSVHVPRGLLSRCQFLRRPAAGAPYWTRCKTGQQPDSDFSVLLSWVDSPWLVLRVRGKRRYGQSSLGGRSCGSAKLLAGTLRCLRLCWLLPLNWSPVEQLGRCPKPHKGRCPLTLQGALPLDPFLAARLERTSLTGLFRGFFRRAKS